VVKGRNGNLQAVLRKYVCEQRLKPGMYSRRIAGVDKDCADEVEGRMSEANGQVIPLVIRLFGACEAWVEGAPLPRLRSRQGLWLLALLALRQERDVSRTWLQATLWPDSLPEQAAYNLRRSLSDLRHALGAQAVRVLSPTPQTLRLDLNGADVDTLAFDRLRKQGDTASLEQAAQCYRGPLLAECGEEWVLEERAFRQEAYLKTLETLAARAEEHGDPAAAIPYLRRIIAVDALRESAHRQLMRTLAQTGAYGGAMQVFRDLRVLLHDQFPPPHAPVLPDFETVLCYRDIRREARRKAALNETRVREEEEPAHTAPKPAAPAAAPAPAPRHNLPRPRTTFIGREKEIAEAGNRLEQAVLLTLTGPGGAGKTRTAQQIALAQLDAYPDGVWLVELAALSEPSLVPQAIAAAVGATEPDGNAPTLATLLRFLPSRALLLVLDNCEHLIEACADVADALLAACPHLRILATSRQALGITGEWLYPVPPLALPASDGENLSETAQPSEAVRLFVERARLVSPDFALTPHNATYVAQICRHLDGIPLAIELAAARIRALSPQQIAARMDDRFALLTGGSRTAEPRQRTLRAAIDWSYDLLTVRERTVFERISVFVGGFTLEAAEFVCLPPLALASRRSSLDLLDALTQLMDKSLLLHLAAEAEGQTDRFDLLETLRQYGQERLQASGDEAETRARHRDFCLFLAEQAQSDGQGMEQVAWYDCLEREGGNLRAALAWSLEKVKAEDTRHKIQDTREKGKDEIQEYLNTEQEKTLRLVNTLWPFWNTRGYIREGCKWLYGALECCPDAAPELRATALRAAGDMARLQGDHAQASVWYEQSLTLARTLGDRSGVAGSLNGLGIMAYFHGDYAQAQALCEEALRIRRDLGDKRGIAVSAEHLAIVMYFRGEQTQSSALYKESLDLKRELGDRKGVAWALGALGSVVCLRGDYAQGAALYAEALTTQRELGDRRGIVYSLEGLAGVMLAQENAHKSALLWGAAEALREGAGLPPTPDGQERHARRIAQARTALGEDAFAAAWAAGRALTWEQASAYALNETVGKIHSPPPLLNLPLIPPAIEGG
jgi:predicted ATPase/DNA-binding SARP family transcriptional activator